MKLFKFTEVPGGKLPDTSENINDTRKAAQRRSTLKGEEKQHEMVSASENYKSS